MTRYSKTTKCVFECLAKTPPAVLDLKLAMFGLQKLSNNIKANQISKEEILKEIDKTLKELTLAMDCIDPLHIYKE